MAIYRLRVHGHTALIQEWSWSLHISAVTDQAGVIADAAADGISAMWNGVPAGTDAVKTLYDTGTVVDGAIVDELDDRGRNVAQGIAPVTIAGTGTGEALPPNVSVVMGLVTALPTRAGRGRSFAVAPTVDTVTGGKLDDGARDIFAAGYKNMIDHMNALGFDVVIYHPSGEPSDFTEVIAVQVGDIYDTQRRRRNKLKEVRTQLALAEGS